MIWMTKYFTIQSCTAFNCDCLNHRIPTIFTLMSSVAPGCLLPVPHLHEMAIKTILPHRKSCFICVHKCINKYHCDLYCKKTCCKRPTPTELCASIICTCVNIPSLATSQRQLTTFQSKVLRLSSPSLFQMKNSPSAWQPLIIFFQVSVGDALKHCRLQAFSHVHGSQVRLHLQTPIH